LFNVILLFNKKARWYHIVLTIRVHVLRMKFQVFADEAGDEVVTVAKPRMQFQVELDVSDASSVLQQFRLELWR
jgi:hypothetical protein